MFFSLKFTFNNLIHIKLIVREHNPIDIDNGNAKIKSNRHSKSCQGLTKLSAVPSICGQLVSV